MVIANGGVEATTVNNKKQFLELVASDQPDLATGALLIARHFQPALNIAAELAVIDNLTLDAEKAGVADARSLVEFFSAAGFQGNSNEYYLSLIHI